MTRAEYVLQFPYFSRSIISLPGIYQSGRNDQFVFFLEILVNFCVRIFIKDTKKMFVVFLLCVIYFSTYFSF